MEITTKYPIEDLKKVFDKICNPDDWKDEINALIPAELYEIAAEAVEFYTTTSLKVIGGPELLTGRILVHAIGYRMGPAGDH